MGGRGVAMEQALRHLVDVGLELDDAARRLSTHPAAYLGDAERGAIARGRFADLVVLRHDLQLESVHVEGEDIELADA